MIPALTEMEVSAMSNVLTPAVIVALKTLAALEVVDRHTAQQVLIAWCRPSPRLAPADVRAILAEFPQDVNSRLDREDPETGAPVPDGVDGFGISGRNPGGTDGR